MGSLHTIAEIPFFGGFMEFEPMRAFLSAENISLHNDYLKSLKLRYSVLCKSAPVLKDLSLNEIWRRLPRSDVKNEAIELLSEIKAHEICFDSFTKKRVPCKMVRERWGSESAFLFELFSAAKETKSGFLYIFSDGEVSYELRDCGGFLFKNRLPVLAVDLFEHAYFKDYGFDRKRYLESAIFSLDLSKITESSKKD